MGALIPQILLHLLIYSSVSMGMPNVSDLHCCSLSQFPAVYDDPRVQPFGKDGLAIRYLHQLERQIGFKCSVLEDFTDVQNFTGFIKEMWACRNDPDLKKDICRCDVGVGGWMQTRKRHGMVDFLPVFKHDDIRVITHLDNTYSSSSGLFFITTFTTGVWFAIAGLLIVWTFLKMLDGRFVPPDESFEPLPSTAPWYSRQKHYVMKSSIPRRLRKSLQSTANRMIGNVEDDSKNVYPSTRQWMLNFTILLSGLFLALSYEAAMTAGLVQETMESDFRSIQDFKSCRIDPSDVCIVDGDVVQSLWESAISSLPCSEGRMPVLVHSYDEAIEKTASKECKFSMLDGATARFATAGKFCRKLVVTGEPTNPSGASYILPRGSEYTELLTNVTMELSENGKLESLDEFYDQWGSCPTQSTSRLSMSRLRYFFISAYGSSVVVFLVMILDPQKPPSPELVTHAPSHSPSEDRPYSGELV